MARSMATWAAAAAAVLVCVVVAASAASATSVSDLFRAARWDEQREGNDWRRWWKVDTDDDDDDDSGSSSSDVAPVGEDVWGGVHVRTVVVREYSVKALVNTARPDTITVADDPTYSLAVFGGDFYVEYQHVDDSDDDDDSTSLSSTTASSSDLDHDGRAVWGVSDTSDDDLLQYGVITALEADDDRYFNVRRAAVFVGRSGTPLEWASRTSRGRGVDPEGIVRAGDGRFWVADASMPSLLKVEVRGGLATVLKRFVPKNSGFTSLQLDTEVVELFPEVLDNFDGGFESLAISQDRSKLYILMGRAGDEDQPLGALRLFVFSTEHERLIGEYVVLLESTLSYDRSTATNTLATISNDDRAAKGLAYIDDHHLLMMELAVAGDYDDANGYARVCVVDLSHATNILGEYDDNTAALDASTVTELPPLVTPAVKHKVLEVPNDGADTFDFDGVQILDARTIGLCTDNDNERGAEEGVRVYRLKHDLA